MLICYIPSRSHLRMNWMKSWSCTSPPRLMFDGVITSFGRSWGTLCPIHQILCRKKQNRKITNKLELCRSDPKQSMCWVVCRLKCSFHHPPSGLLMYPVMSMELNQTQATALLVSLCGLPCLHYLTQVSDYNEALLFQFLVVILQGVCCFVHHSQPCRCCGMV